MYVFAVSNYVAELDYGLYSMNQNIYQLSLTFEQILALVRQLPSEEQVKLSQEIEKNLEKEIIPCQSKTFKSLIQQIQPVSLDFDTQEAKEDYLNQKYNL